MTPGELVALIQRDGVQVTLTPAGRLRLVGDGADRWLAVVGQYGEELRLELQAELLPVQG